MYFSFAINFFRVKLLLKGTNREWK